MKVGDLVRYHRFPDAGYGIVIKLTTRGAEIYWDDGEKGSEWKKTLEVINVKCCTSRI